MSFWMILQSQLLATKFYVPTSPGMLIRRSLLRTQGLLLEMRTEQLLCTMQETKAFLQQVMTLQLPYQTIQEVTARTEGYLRGFVDEGTLVADLLSRLRQERCHLGPTPYFDTLLAAFAKRLKWLCLQSRPRRLL